MKLKKKNIDWKKKQRKKREKKKQIISPMNNALWGGV